MARDQSYPMRGFRLSDETFAQLRAIKGGYSWNQVFESLIEKNATFDLIDGIPRKATDHRKIQNGEA